jgi:predicted PurR-regulated permease PerM
MPEKTAYPIRLAAVLISIALVILGLYLLQDLLILLSFGMILAMLLLPICAWLERRGLPRAISISICLLLLVLVLGGLLLLLIGQAAEFVSDWPIFIKKAESWLNSLQSF